MPSIISQQIPKQFLALRFGTGRRPKVALLVMALIWASGVNARCYTTSQGVILTTPDSALTDHGNGTVTDTRRQLMWMKCSEGQNQTSTNCAGDTTTHTWKAALELAAAKNFAGHSDWRLPNVKELRSLVESACVAPAINATRFPNTQTQYYWTSTPTTYQQNKSWAVNFQDGSSHHEFERDTEYRVRLVRSVP